MLNYNLDLPAVHLIFNLLLVVIICFCNQAEKYLHQINIVIPATKVILNSETKQL